MKNLHRFSVKYNDIYKYLSIHKKINYKHFLTGDYRRKGFSIYDNYILIKEQL